jgi:uncharacterized protein (UPF0332 family)
VPPPVPEDLLEQADGLTIEGASETNLRRAISNAYYALFHLALTAAADMVAGGDSPPRASPRYSLVYRSVDHSRLRWLCDAVRKTNPQKVPLTLPDGFGSLADFARITLSLFELRALADYHPSTEFPLEETRIKVREARQALDSFRQGSSEQREAFLTMLSGEVLGSPQARHPGEGHHTTSGSEKPASGRGWPDTVAPCGHGAFQVLSETVYGKQLGEETRVVIAQPSRFPDRKG